jgi:hypothetical protein
VQRLQPPLVDDIIANLGGSNDWDATDSFLTNTPHEPLSLPGPSSTNGPPSNLTLTDRLQNDLTATSSSTAPASTLSSTAAALPNPSTTVAPTATSSSSTTVVPSTLHTTEGMDIPNRLNYLIQSQAAIADDLIMIKTYFKEEVARVEGKADAARGEVAELKAQLERLISLQRTQPSRSGPISAKNTPAKTIFERYWTFMHSYIRCSYMVSL